MTTAGSSPYRGTMPLYRAVQRALQNDIRNGKYQPGDWLPSESELCRTHQVSATSARRALLELGRLGLIQRFQGRGSMVTSSEIRTASTMLGIGQELRQRGHEVTSQILANSTEAAGEDALAHLHLPPSSEVRHIRRLYRADGEPTVLLDHWVPLKPGITYAAFEGGSFYDFLALHDALPSRAHERVFAGSLSAADADDLEAPAGGAALVRERTSYLVDGSPIEFTRHTSFSDRYQMDIDLEMHA